MKKLAILGASEPHLPLYLKAREMGLETYCVAWSKGAYCKNYADHFCDISIVDYQAVAEMCQQEKIDGAVANALELAVPTLAYLHEKCGFNGNSIQTSIWSTNKSEMRKRVLETRACPQPQFIIVGPDEFPRINYFPVIVKPTDSSASRGITVANSPDELVHAVNRARENSKSKVIMVEQLIRGKEVSVESISYKGKHYLLTITDKETTGEPFFVEIAHHQPSSLPNAIQDKIAWYNTTLLDALQINNSASHAEFKIDESGEVYFMEVGARGGGDGISYKLVELSTGYDFIRGMIQVALDEFEEPVIRFRQYSGIYFLSEKTKSVLSVIHKNKAAPWMVDYFINEDEPLRVLRSSYDRSGYFIYQSDKQILI
ncbi:MAG: ATP-grasp domain-containing protein [Muribaculaceae bacterium]|nr:ATP-grasp domain-containing protein [Muribaculaceae bacterium]